MGEQTTSARQEKRKRVEVKMRKVKVKGALQPKISLIILLSGQA